MWPGPGSQPTQADTPAGRGLWRREETRCQTSGDEVVRLEFFPTWSPPRFLPSDFPPSTSDSNLCMLAAPFLVLRVHVPEGNSL